MKTKITSAVFLDDLLLQGMFYCPYGKETNSCFFSWLQKKSLNEKLTWFKSLNHSDKKDLMYCHSKCPSKASSDYKSIKFYQNN